MDNEKLFMKTSDVSLINHYYIWLLDQIDGDGHQEYSKLLKFLHSKEFYWSIPNDKNRSDDGKELRYLYLRDHNLLGSDAWEEEPCTVLEMLIALAKRINFDIVPDAGKDISYWFWAMLKNLGVLLFFNENWNLLKISEILKDFLDRNYEKSGFGGIFLTQNPREYDFRTIELWYQMHIWIAENVEI